MSLRGVSERIFFSRNRNISIGQQYANDVYYICMEIFETSVFTRQIAQLIGAEEYRQLQGVLVINPLAGVVIKNSGGLRKLRWRSAGKGKSGGIRLIYYYVTADCKIFMLVAYEKSKKDDLTKKQLASLRKLVMEELS